MLLSRIFQILFCSLFAINIGWAQEISRDYQKSCISQQVAEHKGLKGKTLTDADFNEYCLCQAEFVTKNASNQQINELLMNPKAKPEWLKVIESKAIKPCLANSKMNT